MGSQDDLEREAERAVQEKRYWDAEQILIGLEATASPFVFRTLGWMNEMGVSSSPSIERAIDYYKSAIDVGSNRALADLGVALSKASKDAEAIPILRKVSMEGNLSALYHLSCALLRQEDARSRREGMELLKEASDRGHLIAERDLASVEYRNRPSLQKLPSYFWKRLIISAKVFKLYIRDRYSDNLY